MVLAREIARLTDTNAKIVRASARIRTRRSEHRSHRARISAPILSARGSHLFPVPPAPARVQLGIARKSCE